MMQWASVFLINRLLRSSHNESEAGWSKFLAEVKSRNHQQNHGSTAVLFSNRKYLCRKSGRANANTYVILPTRVLVVILIASAWTRFRPFDPAAGLKTSGAA